MPFAENLRKYREKAGYTAKEFSALIDVKYSTYAAYENQGSEPKYETLCKIAATLHVTTDELLGYVYDEYEDCKVYTEKSGRFQVKSYPKGTPGHDPIEVYDTTEEPKRGLRTPLAGYLLPKDFIKAVARAKRESEEKAASFLDISLWDSFLQDFFNGYASRRTAEVYSAATEKRGKEHQP